MHPKLLILNYHRIVKNKSNPTAFDVRLDQFKQQLLFLLENKFNFVQLNHTPQELCTHRTNVALSFDDGNFSDYNEVFPLLQQSGIPATFFVPVEKLEENGLTWQNLRTMSDEGFLVGSHGLSHRDLVSMNPEERFYELNESRKIIEDQLAKPVTLFAYPFGLYDRASLFSARLAGYKTVFTTRFSYNNYEHDGFVLHRWSVKYTTGIEEFKNVLNAQTTTVLNKKTRSATGFLIAKLAGHHFKQRLAGLTGK